MKKEVVLSALKRLGELAADEGLTLELSIYGSVAMMILFNSRVGTKDIDAIMRPKADAKRLAEKVAAEMTLPTDWIESGVTQFLSNEFVARESMTPPPGNSPFSNLRGLNIVSANPRYLLALKARALRKPRQGVEGDWDDITVLIREMGIRSCDEINEVMDEFYPDYQLPLTSDSDGWKRDMLEELIAKIAADRKAVEHTFESGKKAPKTKSRGRSIS